jgi:hypothetical protein
VSFLFNKSEEDGLTTDPFFRPFMHALETGKQETRHSGSISLLSSPFDKKREEDRASQSDAILIVRKDMDHLI